MVEALGVVAGVLIGGAGVIGGFAQIVLLMLIVGGMMVWAVGRAEADYE